MKFQDYIIDSIRKGTEEAFNYAKAVPEDKLNWKPLDLGRSVLDQLQELAQAPGYVTPMLTGVDAGEPDESAYAAMMAERQSWTTVEACEKAAEASMNALFEAIRNFPDEKLSDTKWLPYDGGRDFTMREIMEYPRWNANYHAGQIAYVQILYGDKEMH